MTKIEAAFLAVLGLVCGLLAFLQYRWTGEISRADEHRLQEGMRQDAVRIARDFDSQVREAISVLMPDAGEIAAKGREAAHRERYKDFSDLFSRVAIAVPEDDTLHFYEWNGGLTAAEWPPEWRAFRERALSRLRDDEVRFPMVDPASNRIERPVFGNDAEVEWLLLEVKFDSLRDIPYDLEVRATQQPDRVLFRNAAPIGQTAGAVARLQSGDNGGLGRGRRGRRGQEGGRWELAIRPHDGSFESIVAAARRRNLGISLAMIVLILAAGIALVRFTRDTRRLSEMQLQFVAGVSHELRTPLTAIVGAAHNIQSGVVRDPSHLHRYAALIARNAEDLSGMIEQVLAFSTSRRGQLKIVPSAVPVRDLTEYITSEIAPEISIAPDTPPVWGDAIALRRVLQNLVNNAARHGGSGRWIGISAEPVGESVEIAVEDKGSGVPEAEKSRIFEPFFRGERSHLDHVRGNGLGLSIVRDTVEAHKGTIRVEDRLGGGARFVVTLPIAPEEARDDFADSAG